MCVKMCVASIRKLLFPYHDFDFLLHVE